MFGSQNVGKQRFQSRLRKLKKSMYLPTNGPEVCEIERESGSSLRALPRRQRRRHRTYEMEAKGEVSPLRKSARCCLEVFEIRCGSGSSPQSFYGLGDLLPENDKQTLEDHETLWLETAEDEMLLKVCEIAGSGLEGAQTLSRK